MVKHDIHPRDWGERNQWNYPSVLRKSGLYTLLILLLTLILVGCQPTEGQQPTPSATSCPTPAASGDAGLCNLNTANAASPTSYRAAGVTIPATPSRVQVREKTRPALTSTRPAASPTLPATPEPANLSTTLFLARPISAQANDQVDASYRYGSTQGKKRDPHHGVEFLNPYGTPVLAAADGVVVVAGDDKKNRYSPYFNFYGNLVVIEHRQVPQGSADVPDFQGPVYTLYAHLSEVLVRPGQTVKQGQEIGKVGMTGGATGSHLHFEVRLGENTYAASRNPELWLQPGLDETDQLKGALAVQVTNPQGKPVAVKDVVIAHLVDGPGSASDWEVYVESYEEKALLGNSPWQESFAAGELPVGWYRVTFPYLGLQRQEVQVLPGRVNLAVFKVQ